MAAEKEYLIELLKKSGIKSRIQTNLKSLKNYGETHRGAVLQEKEKITFDGSKRKYDNGIDRYQRQRVFSRDKNFRVIITESDEDKCENILNLFLQNIDDGIMIDGNWSSIVIDEIDWMEEEDNILKAKVAVEFLVTFEGGVYRDTLLKSKEIDNIESGG